MPVTHIFTFNLLITYNNRVHSSKRSITLTQCLTEHCETTHTYAWNCQLRELGGHWQFCWDDAMDDWTSNHLPPDSWHYLDTYQTLFKLPQNLITLNMELLL